MLSNLSFIGTFMQNFRFCKKSIHRMLILLSLIIAVKLGSPVIAAGKQIVKQDSIGLLLSRLDLTKQGLEKVKAVSENRELAAKELLAFYRSRTSVKHPIDRSLKKTSLGNYATAYNFMLADSALKHVFYGMGRVYPPAFCGEDIDWGKRPVPDHEWVWQLNRMYHWTAFAHVYWHTGDEKYVKEWCYQLTDWVRKNPCDKAHDYAWRTIEAGVRGYEWTNLFQHFIDSPSFTPETLVALLNSLYDHAVYLMGKYSKGNNWGLMESEGMAFIAIIFPEFREAEKWKTVAISRLNEEIENQIYPDGYHCELTIGYHWGSIGWFSRTLDLARLNGMENSFPASYLATIEKMCEVLMKLGLPDGSNAQFGDADMGSPGDTWKSLKKWAAIYHRPDFLYVATEGREGKNPEETAYAYDKSGFYSMRSGWNKDDICMVLKCGPDGGWHCQQDNCTFELYAGGRHLMPDAGKYIYHGDPENRAWFRQTRVHQTLTLNGENTAYAPKLLLWQPGENTDVLVVENESYPNLTHRRAMFFVDKKYFVIVDEAIGDGTGDVDIHFQFAPGKVKFDYQGLIAQTVFEDGWNVLVQTIGPNGMKLEEEEGQVSFTYGRKEPRPAFRYRSSKQEKEGVRYLTIVVPYPENPPKIKVRVLGNPKIGSNKVDLEVSADGIVKQIGYSLDILKYPNCPNP